MSDADLMSTESRSSSVDTNATFPQLDAVLPATKSPRVPFRISMKTMTDAGAITGEFIFALHPVKTPSVPAKSSATPPSKTGEEKGEDYEFLCEVPDQCPRQWQKLKKQRRRAVSDLFGRNKKCTQGLPRMISICRMHYQTNSYGKHWGSLRIAFALDQLQRNDEDIPGVIYTIVLKDSECERLIRFLKGEPDLEEPQNGHNRGRVTRVDPRILRYMWKTWVGKDKDKWDCHAMLRWCYALIEEKVLTNTPSIEMLPQLEDPQYAIKAGAWQKKLLDLADKRSFNYNTMEDPTVLLQQLQDEGLMEGDLNSTPEASSGDQDEMMDPGDVGDDEAMFGADELQDNDKDGAEEDAMMPSSPPELHSPESPSPQPRTSGFTAINNAAAAGLPPPPSFAFAVFEQQVNAAFTVGETLKNYLPDDMYQDLHQLKLKLNKIGKAPTHRIAKSISTTARITARASSSRQSKKPVD